MKIISWNINGIRAAVKKNFLKEMDALNWDILCLQETKGQDEEVKKALAPWKDYHIICNSAEKKGYSGTAIISKFPIEQHSVDIGVEKFDNEGRVICLDLDQCYLVNVYVPNSGQQLDRLPYRKEWDANFLKYLKEKEKVKPVIVCGDFNVAHRPIDLKNDKSNYNKTAGYTQIEIDGMDNFIKAGFKDSYRQLNPETIAYTYWSYRFKARERNTGWRIDYFLVSSSLLEQIEKVEILTDIYGSDHCPVSLAIAI